MIKGYPLSSIELNDAFYSAYSKLLYLLGEEGKPGFYDNVLTQLNEKNSIVDSIHVQSNKDNVNTTVIPYLKYLYEISCRR